MEEMIGSHSKLKKNTGDPGRKKTPQKCQHDNATIDSCLPFTSSHGQLLLLIAHNA